MVDTDLIELFRQHGTAPVSDGLDLLGHNGGLPGLGRVSGAGTVVGPAYTLRYEPVDPGQLAAAGEFVDDVPAGAVVVVANAGRTYCTVWGDILSEVATRNGVAGTVIDGACRDVADSRAIGYSIWSRAGYMKSGKNRVRLVAVQQPVEVCGTLVAPGDIVCADDSGAVVVPAALAAETGDQVRRVIAMEALVRADIAAGVPLREARQRHRYNLAPVNRAAAPADGSAAPANGSAAPTGRG